jgi:hypothetical protein
MNWTISIALFCAMIGAAPGQGANNSPDGLVWKPLRVWKSDALPNATVSKEMASKLRLSDMTVELEKTEMTDVQKRFGGTFGEEGDAGTSLEWLCLQGGDATGHWVLWLKSGELNDGSVGSFQWRRVNRAAKFDKRCGMLPKREGSVHLPIALDLGMAEAELLQLLGQPTVRRGNTLLYVHEHEVADQKGTYTALNTLSIVVREGKVTTIDVLKATFAD